MRPGAIVLVLEGIDNARRHQNRSGEPGREIFESGIESHEVDRTGRAGSWDKARLGNEPSAGPFGFTPPVASGDGRTGCPPATAMPDTNTPSAEVIGQTRGDLGEGGAEINSIGAGTTTPVVEKK